MGERILVVDDNQTVAEAVEDFLTRAGYQVTIAGRGAQALELMRQTPPDLVILDILMPGMSGIDVCRHIRASTALAHVPVILLTVQGEIDHKVRGFEAGADDYLTKPFDHRELEARVGALLRRAQGTGWEDDLDTLMVGSLSLDLKTYELTTDENTVMLTPVEFELMQFLMRNAGSVFSADELLQEVWGYPPGTGIPDLVRVHVKNIRDKIEPDPSDPCYLRNILRRGYMVSGS